MGFKIGEYAKVWKIDPSDKYTDVQLSVSVRNPKTNTLTTEFADYVRFIGPAHKKLIAEHLEVGSSIRIDECDVKSHYDTAKKKKYVNFLLFKYTLCESSSPNGLKTAADSTKKQREAVKKDSDWLTIGTDLGLDDIPFS